ncbi:heptaprenyl diphosphate synthase component I [Halalkalibacter akibai JCM 9157]|uniref:Heptaprenyl diphosphate synthase component I n=1 Tax=Halalkalibacter akibai (strain ATCC 43226 / DSM 21942 / CIP 109018 / JCM 9157 / 1139) TaxID=1236973 RepID=W4QR43_HALA3|nr:heptaprenyl diphosphate synthase component I [Halalkalibacter akibai JCM 9157]
MHYYLLAEKKQLPMIRIFSQAIQEINEYKLNLYDVNTLSYIEIQKNTAQIESVLLQNMADHFDQTNWKSVMNDFFFLKRLLMEKAEWIKGRTSPIIHSIIKESGATEDQLKCIEEKVEDVKDRLLTNSKELLSFERFVIEHVDELIGRFSFQKGIEEGELR